MVTERQAVYTHGARFFDADDGTLMWEFIIDHGNKHGPRPATDEDKKKYPEAFKAYENPAKHEPPGEPEADAVIKEAKDKAKQKEEAESAAKAKLAAADKEKTDEKEKADAVEKDEAEEADEDDGEDEASDDQKSSGFGHRAVKKPQPKGRR